MSDDQEDPTLHIYAQPYHHQTAYLVGNRRALEALYGLLGEALAADVAVTKGQASFYVNDGEGYSVVVIEENGDWRGIAEPYTDDFLSERAAAAPRYPTSCGLTGSPYA